MNSPILQVSIPIRTRLGLNSREHWRARSARVKKEREQVGLALLTVNKQLRAAYDLLHKGDTALAIGMKRISPGTLDDDNLVGSLKGIRDAVAFALGIDDRDKRVAWIYEQGKGAPKEYAVRVRIERLPAISERCPTCGLSR